MAPRRESWVASNIISREVGESENYVKNVQKLLKSDHTIPFIARYRKEMIGDMSIEQLYKIKEQMGRLDNLSKKIEKSLKDIEKMNCLTPELEEVVRSCSSLVTLEQVTAEYKPGKKKSRAEQAKALGLDQITEEFFTGHSVNFQSLIGSNDSLKSTKSVINGVKDILAERLRINKTVLECCETACSDRNNVLECTESKSKSKDSDKVSKDKFDQYFNFQRNIGSIKPYQTMAINRGENLKALSVKVQLSHNSQNLIKNKCYDILKHVRDEKIKREIIEDACSRLVFPLVCRRIRSALTEAAVEGSVDVFANNLKHLLLTRPITGIRILALDPGFTNGCKAAVLNEIGEPLKTDVYYLDGNNKLRKMDEMKIKMLHNEYRFDTIAIGNGTACRETERAVAKLINMKYFSSPVKYTIVDERGASIYSVTKLAQEELPGLDTNHRSAVSIGRRVLDPLSEYVKIEPSHLGVGQYQHDIPDKKLNNRLNNIVTEAVSFTGLDVNKCQQHMLERVAGLTKARASAIISWRKTNGYFMNRHQIQGVKGIGSKSFEQCIGFLRVYPGYTTPDQETGKRTRAGSDEDYNFPETGKRKRTAARSSKSKKLKVDICYLDQTSVHPESYHLAEKLIVSEGLKLSDIGTKPFIKYISSLNPGVVADMYGSSEGVMSCILSSLSQDLDTDYRDQFAQPIFKDNITTVETVGPGTELEGRVSNVTHFGAFADVGLGKDGLIHTSQMRGQTLVLGQRVKTVVVKKDCKGIGLRLISVMN